MVFGKLCELTSHVSERREQVASKTDCDYLVQWFEIQRPLHFSACTRTRQWTLSWKMISWYTVDTGFLHRKPEEWYSYKQG